MSTLPTGSPPPSPLDITIDGDIAVVAFNRPEKRNALNDATIRELLAFFSSPPEGVRAVVVTGRGDHFSAGLDLSDVVTMSVEGSVAKSQLWYRAFDAIQYGSIPVVGALVGAVIGGGLELASALHIRVAGRSAFYALPEGQRGIFVGGGGSIRIPKLIGLARMTDLMMTGRVYDADEGHRIGISQYLVDDADVREEAIRIAKRVAQNAPLSNYAVMNVLPHIADAHRSEAFLLEAFTAAFVQQAPEAKARVADFLAKRAPRLRADE